MEVFSAYLMQIENPQQRERIKEIFDWVKNTFPELEARIAWNQPMFTDHGTFIIGLSISQKHLAVSPELAGMEHFTEAITKAGYGQSKMLFRMKWEEPVDYSLLDKIIKFNRLDKAECKTFWRS